jgi:multiple antibiotic resistance protein
VAPIPETLVELAKSVIVLFIVLDPIGTTPYYQTLTSRLNEAEKARVLRLTVVVAGFILLAFAIIGDTLFQLLNITLGDFRIAAGLVLLVTSLALLLEIPLGFLRGEPEKVAIVPLATPLLAGPAAVSVTLLIKYTSGPHIAVVAVVINMIIAYIILALSNRVVRILGRQGLVILDKFMSLIMAALAISLIRQGVEEVYEW